MTQYVAPSACQGDAGVILYIRHLSLLELSIRENICVIYKLCGVCVQPKVQNHSSIPLSQQHTIRKRSHSCGSNESLSMSTASDVNTIEEPMEDSNALSTSGINSNISENSSFIEHTKRPRKKSEDVEFQKHLVNILSECNKPADGIDGFLIYLGDILKRLPFKERRALQKAIFDLAYEAEERAGFTK
ncbi:PREDICTED: uncharacterized protein LOC105565466 isoform X1 [Vollenhovia emeryi]|uniref:uncharacterized protein LOC105565466 isoform X1 n=1 Tax=Vollenhovia emeryi TaxID=411798 RepID=UPI0005F42473|nr:PREDICTED: uncharacterized protein LOC105565466 isoform X1 [Vollenhovia emeryi]